MYPPQTALFPPIMAAVAVKLMDRALGSVVHLAILKHVIIVIMQNLVKSNTCRQGRLCAKCRERLEAYRVPQAASTLSPWLIYL